MTDIRHASKEFLTEFIDIYRSHPALWKVKSKEYVNRTLKNTGYDALVEFYRQVDSSADRDLVSKKIQSMRGSFRKELKKFEKFNNSSASDVQYVPSLWYFDLLMFTKEQETHADNFDIGFDSMAYSPVCQMEDNPVPVTDDHPDYGSSKNEATAVQEHEEEEEEEEGEIIKVFKKPTKGTKRRITTHECEQQTCLRGCTESLKQCDAMESESVIFGKFVASKHVKLNQLQQMYAESLITSVLHKAALNKLTEHTVVSEKQPKPGYFSPPSKKNRYRE